MYKSARKDLAFLIRRSDGRPVYGHSHAFGAPACRIRHINVSAFGADDHLIRFDDIISFNFESAFRIKAIDDVRLRPFGIGNLRRHYRIYQNRPFGECHIARDLEFGDDIAAFDNFIRRPFNRNGIDIVVDMRQGALRNGESSYRIALFQHKTGSETKFELNFLHLGRKIRCKAKQIICSEICGITFSLEISGAVITFVADRDRIRLCGNIQELVIYFDSDPVLPVR